MPSLIRLLIVLLVLGGVIYGAMVALVMLVEPEPGPVTVRIPARDLLGDQAGNGTGSPLPGLVQRPAAPGNETDAPANAN